MADRKERFTPTAPNFELTEEQVKNARLTVARNAENAEDLAFLLDVLGLLPPKEEPNDAKEIKALRRKELAEMREAAKVKLYYQQLSWLHRNDY